MDDKGITVLLRTLPDHNILLDTVSDHRVLIVRSALNPGVDKPLFTSAVSPEKDRRRPPAPLPAVFSRRYRDPVFAAGKREQLAVLLPGAEPDSEPVPASGIVPSVALAHKPGIRIDKGIRRPVKHMNRSGIEHRLLRTVTHVKHLSISRPQTNDLGAPENLFSRILSRQDNLRLRSIGQLTAPRLRTDFISKFYFVSHVFFLSFFDIFVSFCSCTYMINLNHDNPCHI